MSSLYTIGIELPDYVNGILKDGIPKIGPERLLELYSRIKPLITIDGERYLLDNLSLEDLVSLSYLSLSNNSVRVIENLKKVGTLEEIRDFICLHKYGFSLQFRPSVNEILSQIPEDLVDEVDAFDIIEKPVLPNNLHMYPLVTKRKYHLSRVMTYKLK